jgi:cell division protein FtsB
MYRRKSRRGGERRKAFLLSLLKLVLAVSAFGLTAYYSYEVGLRVAQGETSSLKDKLEETTQEAHKQQEQAVGDRAALNEARKQAEDFKALYEQVKPTEDIKELTTILRAKLAEGLDSHRLGMVIKTAQNPHDCEQPATRRFLVRTPRYKGPDTNTSVRLGDLVTLSADGVGGNGGHEQWFDAERPIKLHVVAGGVKDADVSGRLPIEHMVVVKNSEFRFTISAATSRGFVEVVSQRCEYR